MLVVDLDSNSLGDPEVDGALALCTESTLRGLRRGQGSCTLARGRGSPTSCGALPQAGLARSPAAQPLFSVHDCRRGASVSVRLAGSLGSGAAAGLRGFRRGGLASRLEALEAQVRTLVTSQTALLSI